MGSLQKVTSGFKDGTFVVSIFDFWDVVIHHFLKQCVWWLGKNPWFHYPFNGNVSLDANDDEKPMLPS